MLFAPIFIFIILFLLYVLIFTNYVFISMIHIIMSTFTKCDNIITLVNQPLTLCAIRYLTDQVKLCLLLFLYAFIVYELFNIVIILCCLFVLANIL